MTTSPTREAVERLLDRLEAAGWRPVGLTGVGLGGDEQEIRLRFRRGPAPKAEEGREP